MKKFVLIGTGLFWIAVLLLVGSGLISRRNATPSAQRSAGVSGKAPMHPLRREDVAAHASVTDCWVIIGREVYDITSYLPNHPAPAEVLPPWCGRDATQAYHDKGGLGRSHSVATDELLAAFSIGQLKE